MLKSILGRKEQEESVKEMGRLPPGQALTNRFPVLHYGPVPRFSPAAWDLRVFGEVEEEKRWTWDEFNKLPRGKVLMDIHCVTRWSKFDTEWEGVYLRTLVDEGFIKLKPTARHLLQHCEYGFTVNIPLDIALRKLSAGTHYAVNSDHGYPLRASWQHSRQGTQDAVFLEGRRGCAGWNSTRPTSLAFGSRPVTTTRPTWERAAVLIRLTRRRGSPPSAANRSRRICLLWSPNYPVSGTILMAHLLRISSRRRPATANAFTIDTISR